MNTYILWSRDHRKFICRAMTAGRAIAIVEERYKTVISSWRVSTGGHKDGIMVER